MNRPRLPAASPAGGELRKRPAAGRDDDEPPPLSAAEMGAALAMVMLAACLIAGSLFSIGRGAGIAATSVAPRIADQPSTRGSLRLERARAQAENAKLSVPGRPPAPANLPATVSVQRVAEASAGQHPGRTSAPVPVLVRDETTAPVERPPPRSAPEAAEAPVAAAAAEPVLVQLGAYSSRARADLAWDQARRRFPAVAMLPKIVVPFESGFRLRAAVASPSQAKALCAVLSRGGQGCFVVR